MDDVKQKPKAPTVPCSNCHGEGQKWICWAENGFEYGHYWSVCERCNGDGEEPQPEKEDDDDT
jgi:DnaJ-class molecular chaperone